MERFSFPAKLTPDKTDGGFLVTFRDLKGAITQGESVKDALRQAADCLEEYVAFCLMEDRDVPRPSKPRTHEYLVPVAPRMAAKAALRQAMREAGVSNVRLAKQVGCDEKDVRRMLDPRHKSKITTLQQALAALGKQIVLSVENTA